MRRTAGLSLAAAAILAAVLPLPVRAEEPIMIGLRVEPFVDRHLIDKLDGAELRMHAPRAEEKVLFFDKPWEGATSAYVTVFKDGDRFRMYYRGSGQENDPKPRELTCYAESRDGIAWTKPELGLVEFEGSKANNIVWDGPGTHNFAPFLDARPGVAAEERYKALAGGPLLALASGDGIHWRKLREEPVITKGAFDSQNLAFWSESESQYVSYFRVFKDGIRAISRTVSADFLNWSEPQEIDLGPGPVEHLYTNATTPYFRAPHIYLSFPMRFMPDRTRAGGAALPGVSDGVMMTTRDGVHFARTFTEAFVRPGRDPLNWTDRNVMAAWGVVQTAPDEISLYYSNNYRHPSAHMRRFSLRLDGFASVGAPLAGGEMVTKPVVFEGNALAINFATSAAGSLRLELQDAAGKPIEGFSLADSEEIFGDEIARIAKWKGDADLSALAGKPVRLRAAIKDGDLYSIRFQP